MTLPIIIDTDPGIDDAVALLAALASSELDIIGITPVAGNVRLETAVSNAYRILSLAGKEASVCPGCERPLIKPLETAHDVHGTEGMGSSWPDISVPPSQLHGVDFLIKKALAHRDKPLTLCMLGPLTNLAMALIREPAVKEGIRQIVLMGGALKTPGNVTPFAEFNFHVDPHAAAVVFDSGLPIVMAPLDVTNKALLPDGWLAGMKKQKSAACKAVYDMLNFYRSGQGGGLHDPCVIAWLLAPELFRTSICDVKIEIYNREKLGQCIPEWKADGSVTAMMDIDNQGFFSLLTERLVRL